MSERSRRVGRGIGGTLLAVAAGVLVAAGAGADGDSCRDWRGEHLRWKTEALRRYLRGAPPREVDAAVFELLQREAYLTSCDVSVQGGRDDLVGWRLVGRVSDEYGSSVVESVLERAGFPTDLRPLFQPGVHRVVVSAPPARSRRGVRSR